MERCSIAWSIIFQLIVSLCERLIDLNFCQSTNQKIPITILELLSTNRIYPTLTKLKINVRYLGDCLYLLDDHFDCLSTLIIYVVNISFGFSSSKNVVCIVSIVLKCKKGIQMIRLDNHS
jgi:hypothetical protein